MLQKPDKLWPYEPLGSCDDLTYLISLIYKPQILSAYHLILVSKRAMVNKGMCDL